MKNFIEKSELKAMTTLFRAKSSTDLLIARAKKAFVSRDGQGTLDVAITVLISIVLGALILAGLYLIINGTVLPTITQKIKDMFNYSN